MPEVTAIERVQPNITPMALIQSAVMQGAGIDTIERLAKLQRELVEYDAKVEFNKAMMRAQKAMRRIGADATNPQTRSKYATYAKLDSAVRPVYTNEGFGLSFDEGTSPVDMVQVLCYVSHDAGYTRTYHVDMPADGKGAKGGDVMTKTHAHGAAMSYGSRYLLKMIFNLAVGETDDDGNGAGISAGIPLQVVASKLDCISLCDNLAELQRVFADAYTDAKTAKDKSAMAQYIAAKDARKAELA